MLSDNQTQNTDLISLVRTAANNTGRTLAEGFTLPTGGVLLDGFSGFKSARFGVVERGEAVADNKSVSSPFGSKNTGGELYDDAVKAIKDIAAVKTFGETKGNRIYFTPEII